MVSLEGYLNKMHDVPECDVGLNSSEEVSGGFVDSDEGSVVELSQSEKSEDADGPGVEFVDTPDSDHECHFGLSRDVDLTCELGISAGVGLVLGGLFVAGLVGLDSLQQFSSLGFIGGSPLLAEFLETGGDLGISFFLLLEAFGLGGNFLTCH